MDELFKDLVATHSHEEKLRLESLALITQDAGVAGRLKIVQSAMALIFAFTVEHTALSPDDTTKQFLGTRLFNAAASGIKLALSGYYQPAFHQARDIMETGFLLDYFRTSPEQVQVWRESDRRTRRNLFDPVKIRTALDARDGGANKHREREYNKLSELASHATVRGFQLTMKDGAGELGPFVDVRNLVAWLEEMRLRLGPSAWIYTCLFPNADPKLILLSREFGTELVQGHKS